MGFDDGNWVINFRWFWYRFCGGFAADYLYICLVMQVRLGVCEFGKIGN